MASTEAPVEPFVPADLDLRDFRWMKLDLIALFNSDFNATPDDTAWRAGVTLWGKAWHQVPAGSLPDDDARLATLAGLGRDQKTWRRIRAQALHGFVKCLDGRLYHRFLCMMAVEAAAEKAKFDRRKAADRARKSSGIPAETASGSSGIPAETAIIPAEFHRKNALEGQGEGQDKEAPRAKPFRIPRVVSESESISARARLDSDEEGEKINGMSPIGRFAPLGADGKGSAIRRKRKELLTQKLFRFCKATMNERQREEAMMGLLANDPIEAQSWFDRLDKAMRSARWDDVAAC